MSFTPVSSSSSADRTKNPANPPPTEKKPRELEYKFELGGRTFHVLQGITRTATHDQDFNDALEGMTTEIVKKGMESLDQDQLQSITDTNKLFIEGTTDKNTAGRLTINRSSSELKIGAYETHLAQTIHGMALDIFGIDNPPSENRNQVEGKKLLIDGMNLIKALIDTDFKMVDNLVKASKDLIKNMNFYAENLISNTEKLNWNNIIDQFSKMFSHVENQYETLRMREEAEETQRSAATQLQINLSEDWLALNSIKQELLQTHERCNTSLKTLQNNKTLSNDGIEEVISLNISDFMEGDTALKEELFRLDSARTEISNFYTSPTGEMPTFEFSNLEDFKVLGRAKIDLITERTFEALRRAPEITSTVNAIENRYNTVKDWVEKLSPEVDKTSVLPFREAFSALLQKAKTTLSIIPVKDDNFDESKQALLDSCTTIFAEFNTACGKLIRTEEDAKKAAEALREAKESALSTTEAMIKEKSTTLKALEDLQTLLTSQTSALNEKLAAAIKTYPSEKKSLEEAIEANNQDEVAQLAKIEEISASVLLEKSACEEKLKEIEGATSITEIAPDLREFPIENLTRENLTRETNEVIALMQNRTDETLANAKVKKTTMLALTTGSEILLELLKNEMSAELREKSQTYLKLCLEEGNALSIFNNGDFTTQNARFLANAKILFANMEKDLKAAADAAAKKAAADAARSAKKPKPLKIENIKTELERINRAMNAALEKLLTDISKLKSDSTTTTTNNVRLETLNREIAGFIKKFITGSDKVVQTGDRDSTQKLEKDRLAAIKKFQNIKTGDENFIENKNETLTDAEKKALIENYKRYLLFAECNRLISEIRTPKTNQQDQQDQQLQRLRDLIPAFNEPEVSGKISAVSIEGLEGLTLLQGNDFLANKETILTELRKIHFNN